MSVGSIIQRISHEDHRGAEIGDTSKKARKKEAGIKRHHAIVGVVPGNRQIEPAFFEHWPQTSAQ